MIRPSDLAAGLKSSTAPVVVDVRLADDFTACHIDGALNHAVFEVAFNERLPVQIPDRSSLVRIYGASSSSLEGRMAVEKLERAGYRNVQELDGGLEAWQAAGLLVVQGPAFPPAPTLPDGRLEVDTEASRVDWRSEPAQQAPWLRGREIRSSRV